MDENKLARMLLIYETKSYIEFVDFVYRLNEEMEERIAGLESELKAAKELGMDAVLEEGEVIEQWKERCYKLEKENERLRLEEMAATMNLSGALEIMCEENSELRLLLPDPMVRDAIRMLVKHHQSVDLDNEAGVVKEWLNELEAGIGKILDKIAKEMEGTK